MPQVEITYPSAEGAECPYPLYETLRAEAPVMQVPGTNNFLVTRWSDVQYVCRHPELFSSDSRRSRTPFDSFGDKAPTVRGMVELDPPKHKPRRDACRLSLTPRRLRDYEPMVREIVTDLVDRVAGTGRFEMVEEFARPLPMYVMMRLFGFTEDDREWVRAWSLVETSGSVFISTEAQEQQIRYARRAGERLLEELIDRYKHPGEDILSEIVARNVERSGHFDEAQVRADASNMFRGGIITVAHALPMATCLLLENPDQLDAVRSDRTLIPRMFEEALRVESPSQWNPRIATADTELGGVRIPKGAYVMIFWASGNRDEDVFDDGMEFDVRRENVAKHLSFGNGPHFCVGAPLARLEARVAFEELLVRLPGLRLASDADATHVASPAFRGLRRLDLEFDVGAD
jgi:cytochrome P450